ncbi:complement C1q-like protein 4 [Engraulis encrasicolus]|uniref:complement C1q-like protein 4 n=1 Tax=Engraulis encrasicolus TaxID=184585 RepID=UPI002FD28EFF
MRATSSLFLLLVGVWVGAAMELKCFANGPVAFYASLTGVDGYTGPYDTMTTLVYKKVITNLGEAYNPATGIFVAPVKGIYHFAIYYHSPLRHYADLYLQKNGVTIATTSHQKPTRAYR